jgi:hypothetical protein
MIREKEGNRYGRRNNESSDLKIPQARQTLNLSDAPAPVKNNPPGFQNF